MTESDDERRRGERVPINDEFARFGGGGPGSTWVSDLSLGGVFVHTDDPQPVGAMIELRFTVVVDDPVVIEAVAQVVRHSYKPRGMGVKFMLLTELMRERIVEVLAQRQPLDSGAPVRLPEPSRARFELPADDDDDRSVDVDARPRILAQPAPVAGLDVRRVSEDAVTAAFPRVEEAKTQVYKAVDAEADEPDEVDEIEIELEDEDEDDEPAPRAEPPPPPPQFKRPPPPPKPQARAHATRDDARTTVYKAVPQAAAASDDDDDG